MENMPLWHERHISHSSVERVIGPDSTILMDYMLNRMTGIIDRLVVHVDRMLENLHKMKGLTFSQRILMKLAIKGLEIQKIYVMVRRVAMNVWEEGLEFKGLILEAPPTGKYLSKKEIEEIFDLEYQLKYVNEIFERVFT